MFDSCKPENVGGNYNWMRRSFVAPFYLAYGANRVNGIIRSIYGAPLPGSV